MTTRVARLFAVIALLAAYAHVAADDRTEYNRRAAQRYVALFQELDRDANSAVTRVEASGDLNFVPWFDDMDINRDGIVTFEELQHYLEQRYGVRVERGRP
jgi:EF hand